MVLALGLVALGLVLLVLGGEALLRGAVGLATLLRLTPAMIGLTVVAAGTSMPEFAVSVLAAARDQTDIAVGNVVGSNICNIGLILGLCATVRPLAISGSITKLEYPVLALVTLLCVAVCEDQRVSRTDAALFIAIYVCFTAYLVSLVRQRISIQEERELAGEVQELTVDHRRPHPARALLLVAAGILLLTGGAHATVLGAVDIGRYFRLSESVIGLTIVAVGTSLPEIVTSLVSSYRGRDDVAINNVIGSNLFNLLGILGMSAAVAPLPVAAEIVAEDNWWMLGFTLGLFPILYTGLHISRVEGAVLLSAYCAYVTRLLTRPG